MIEMNVRDDLRRLISDAARTSHLLQAVTQMSYYLRSLIPTAESVHPLGRLPRIFNDRQSYRDQEKRIVAEAH